MPLPFLNYYAANPSPAADDSQDPYAATVVLGPLQAWFSASTLVAFRGGEGELVVRGAVGDGPARAERDRHTAAVPGQRFVGRLPDAEFEAAWHAATDKLLFPRRVGKLRKDWPDLTPDVPLGVLADWLQEHGCDEAARVLRAAEHAAPQPSAGN